MGLFDFLTPVQDALEQWLIHLGVTVPPWSGVLLIFISLILSSVTGLLNRALLDLEELQKKTDEMQEHQKLKNKAMETADKKLWIKVKRNEERFLELQKDTMMKRMVPSIITMGPFIFMFNTLRAAFQQAGNLAMNYYCTNGDKACIPDTTKTREGGLVVLPFKADKLWLIGSWFSPYAKDQSVSIAGFGFWYFMSAIVVSTLIQKLFGINLTGMQNPGQPGAGLR